MSLKILFLSHFFYPDVGGIEINAEILADEFVNAGHNVHMLTWSKGNIERKFKYKIIRNPNVLKLIREHAWADVVFENNPCLRLAWPRLFLRTPSIIALNTWVARVNGTRGFQDKIKSWWLKHAHKVIAVSNAVRKHSWPEAIVIGNPYKADTFRVMAHINKTKTFVFLGRLVSTKGADMAIQAIHKIILKTGLDLINASDHLLTIIGEGPDRNKLENLAHDLGLEEVVHFTGLLSGNELAACLNSHQYIIIPSVWEEPFGNVALEGMACGCIPIASNGGGLPDAVGNAGLLFERGDLDALTESMIKILCDNELKIKLQSASKSHLNNHQPVFVANKYLETINASLKK